ncbi:flagellar motor switch protein FliG [Erythrobacter sp. JK5]|nr:flagellar motor switch protein FliG [Erythrobacter sp. JK5]
MLLGDEEAANLLARLGPNELERLGSAMVALGEVDQPGIAEALQDFVSEADREVLPAKDRSVQVRSLLERSLGSTKAESMMQRIEPEARPRSIEMARWLAPNVLLKLVEDEHPQVIAALLLMLDPEPAAEVLSALPEDKQANVVTRVAKIGPISSQAIAMIDSLLSQRIGASFGSSALVLGGPREAANLINLAEGELARTVLPTIAQLDPALAEAIEEEMFTFEMLLELDPQAMGRLLRDVENEALVDALKGLKDEQRAPFFAAMSSRAADGIRDEIELRGRLARSEVQVAQRKIVEVARSLADQGEIVIGSDDGEFV